MPILTSIINFVCRQQAVSLKLPPLERSSWYLSVPIPLVDLPEPNLHSLVITATVKITTISTTTTINSTDTNNTHLEVLQDSDVIFPVVAISNNSSWNTNETCILDNTKFLILSAFLVQSLAVLWFLLPSKYQDVG